MMKKEFQGTSKRARDLLSRAEGTDVDYKTDPGGVSAEDLVAFANSPKGGAMLLGVEETKDAQGRQRGQICGCDVGDRTRQRILSRALSCFPPVTIEVFVENVAHKPFLRVEIPRGARRPYSTGGGTYKIRDDGQNRALRPAELLAVFLETEESQFVDRFRAAANELSADIELMQTAMVSNFMSATSALEDEVDRVRRDFADLGKKLEERLRVVLDLTENAVGTSEEAAAGIEDVRDTGFQLLAVSEGIQSDNSMLHERLRVLLEHHGIEDPEERQSRVMLQTSVKILLERYPNATAGDFLEMLDASATLYGPKARSWIEQVLNKARDGRTSGT